MKYVNKKLGKMRKSVELRNRQAKESIVEVDCWVALLLCLWKDLISCLG